MSISGSTRRAFCALLLLAQPLFAAAQANPPYPARPIRLIVPYPPGGPLDTAARALAESVKDTLGVIVVIESVRDLVAYARKNPGKLNYASGGNGSGGHMAGELLKSMARVAIVHIPYAGAAAAQLGMLAGQTDLMFDNLASAAPQIRAGNLRAFAVTTARRAPAFPELPTLAEAGGSELAGFEVSTWFGVLAPAGTPAEIVAKLNDTMRAALSSATLRERLARMGAEPAPTSPAEFVSLIKTELAKYERVVKFSGAKVD